MASNELAEIVIHAPDLDWLDDTNCDDMDPSDFFVEAGHIISSEVIQTCKRCQVREDCLLYCYQRDIASGYFAGLSPGQRRKMTYAEALAYIRADSPDAPEPAVLPIR